MSKVAIYAIALNSAPAAIRYVGSTGNLSRRFREHRNCREVNQLKREWFQKHAHDLRYYVIEWVDELLRLDAEAYWFTKFFRIGVNTGSRLINSAWDEAHRRAEHYTPTVDFDPANAAYFVYADGMKLTEVKPNKMQKNQTPFWVQQVAVMIGREAPWLTE